MLTLPLNTRLLSSSQNYSPFLSRMTKGKSPRGRHLIITGRAIILILIIIVITIIAILIYQSLRRKRWRSSKTTKVSLSSCNTIDTSVLTHLITESVKVSIHALKVHHDNLEGHTTIWGRRNGGGTNSIDWSINRLHPWLLRSKLGLAPPNRSCVDGTHNGVIRRIRNRDRKMAKDSCDSRREDELIMGRRIPINIYDRSNEMRGEVNGKIL